MMQPVRHPASFALREKIGSGPVPDETIRAMMLEAKSITPDLTPVINASLGDIKTALDAVAAMSYGREEFLGTIIRHVMDIKALSGMFAQKPIQRPAQMLLDFLEDVHRLDTDIVDIITGFINVITRANVPDTTDYDAEKMLTALRAACKRYYDKAARNISGS